ncbi:hypothetical protein C8F01DRAFT_1184441, partial [Mycena amicta]
ASKMPFILPAEGQPVLESMSLDREWEWDWNWQPTWQWLSSLSLSQLQLPLTILAALFVLLAVRAFLLARITPAKEQPIPQKGQRMESASEKTTWLVFSLFKTSTSTPAPDMLEAQMQAHFDVPVVHVHRPRAQKPSRLAIDTPLPTVYVSEVPASMAKLIMSRHTFRRVSPPSSPTTSRSPRRSPSPPKYSSASPSSDAP